MAVMGELDILVKAVGAGKAKTEVEDAQKGLGDTAKKASKDTKAMENFSRKFAGVMSIVAASMAAATGVLLAKVPVLGELWASMGFLVQEIAYLLDEVLRPVLEPLTDAIFELSMKFQDLPGPAKTFIAVLVLLAAFLLPVLSAIVAIIAGATGMALVIAVLTLAVAGLILALAPLVAVLSLIYFAWTDNWFGIRDIVTAVVEYISELIDGFLSWMNEAFGEEFRATVESLRETVGFWVSLITGAIEAITTIIRLGLGVIKAMWDSDFLFMRTIIITTFGIIERVITTAWKILSTIIEMGINNIMNIIQILLALLRGDFTAVWGSIKDIVKNMVDGIGTILGTIKGSVKSVLNAIIGFINKVIDGLNSISIDIPDWVPEYGGKTFGIDIAKIPTLQYGGIITEPTLALAGEAGPEAFIPLDRLEEMMAGRGNITVTLEVDGRKLAEIVRGYNNEAATGRGWM